MLRAHQSIEQFRETHAHTHACSSISTWIEQELWWPQADGRTDRGVCPYTNYSSSIVVELFFLFLFYFRSWFFSATHRMWNFTPTTIFDCFIFAFVEMVVGKAFVHRGLDEKASIEVVNWLILHQIVKMVTNKNIVFCISMSFEMGLRMYVCFMQRI